MRATRGALATFLAKADEESRALSHGPLAAATQELAHAERTLRKGGIGAQQAFGDFQDLREQLGVQAKFLVRVERRLRALESPQPTAQAVDAEKEKKCVLGSEHQLDETSSTQGKSCISCSCSTQATAVQNSFGAENVEAMCNKLLLRVEDEARQRIDELEQNLQQWLDDPKDGLGAMCELRLERFEAETQQRIDEALGNKIAACPWVESFEEPLALCTEACELGFLNCGESSCEPIGKMPICESGHENYAGISPVGKRVGAVEFEQHLAELLDASEVRMVEKLECANKLRSPSDETSCAATEGQFTKTDHPPETADEKTHTHLEVADAVARRLFSCERQKDVPLNEQFFASSDAGEYGGGEDPAGPSSVDCHPELADEMPQGLFSCEVQEHASNTNHLRVASEEEEEYPIQSTIVGGLIDKEDGIEPIGTADSSSFVFQWPAEEPDQQREVCHEAEQIETCDGDQPHLAQDEQLKISYERLLLHNAEVAAVNAVQPCTASTEAQLDEIGSSVPDGCVPVPETSDEVGLMEPQTSDVEVDLCQPHVTPDLQLDVGQFDAPDGCPASFEWLSEDGNREVERQQATSNARDNHGGCDSAFPWPYNMQLPALSSPATPRRKSGGTSDDGTLLYSPSSVGYPESSVCSSPIVAMQDPVAIKACLGRKQRLRGAARVLATVARAASDADTSCSASVSSSAVSVLEQDVFVKKRTLGLFASTNTCAEGGRVGCPVSSNTFSSMTTGSSASTACHTFGAAHASSADPPPSDTAEYHRLGVVDVPAQQIAEGNCADCPVSSNSCSSTVTNCSAKTACHTLGAASASSADAPHSGTAEYHPLEDVVVPPQQNAEGISSSGGAPHAMSDNWCPDTTFMLSTLVADFEEELAEAEAIRRSEVESSDALAANVREPAGEQLGRGEYGECASGIGGWVAAAGALESAPSRALCALGSFSEGNYASSVQSTATDEIGGRDIASAASLSISACSSPRGQRVAACCDDMAFS